MVTQILQDLLFDYTLRTVALGSAVLGLVSGALGTYAVLRKQSLLGDAMSHAALPGVVLAFILFRSKSPLVLIIGAMIAGWVGTILIMNIVNLTRIKEDSAMGLVLSVFFGFGLMLLTYIQRIPDAGQAGLDRFLFGQAATLLQSDVITMAIIGGIALLLMMIFWKEFKINESNHFLELKEMIEDIKDILIELEDNDITYRIHPEDDIQIKKLSLSIRGLLFNKTDFYIKIESELNLREEWLKNTFKQLENW